MKIFNRKTWLATAVMVWLITGNATAQEYSDTIRDGKTYTNATMVGVGGANILDTYLSQEKYRGLSYEMVYHRTIDRADSRWSKQIIHSTALFITQNRANTGNEWELMYNYQHAWLYNWDFLDGRLNIKAGGAIDADGGYLQNDRNSNNPLSVKAHVSIMPKAIATYKFKCGSHPAAVRYEIGVPLVGTMFSLNYGQSYYELGKDDYDRNLVLTHFINAPSLKQMLTLDYTTKKTTLRIGYLGYIRQSDVNNIKCHNYNHSLVIGIVKRFNILKIRP